MADEQERELEPLPLEPDELNPPQALPMEDQRIPLTGHKPAPAAAPAAPAAPAVTAAPKIRAFGSVGSPLGTVGAVQHQYKHR